jgi:hypothetical protein
VVSNNVPIQAYQSDEQAVTQAQFDHLVLTLMRSGDCVAAQSLGAVSQLFSNAQSDDAARVFWQWGAAFFEAIALGLCPITVESKRTIGQILLQYRALQLGNTQGLSPVVQALVYYCTQVEPAPAVATPRLSAMRATLALEPPPVLEREQFKVIGALRIEVSAFNVFLNEADEWSRLLVTELNEWALEAERPVQANALFWARDLSIRSGVTGFSDLADFALTLHKALHHLQASVPCEAAHAQIFINAAEEIRRLLHQFAAGFLKTPDAQLVASLQALAALDLAQRAPARAFKLFQEEALALMPQLRVALRQWIARPENLSARNEVLRGLRIFLAGAQLADDRPLWAHADALRLAILLWDTTALQTQAMSPLLVQFESVTQELQSLKPQTA